jgi:predicted O-linked N-acetylglucosamine transferase (SPINDLY family)
MRAESAAREPAAEQPGDTEIRSRVYALFVDAQRALKAAQGDRAAPLLAEALNLSPTNPDAFNLLSVAFGQMGRHLEAVQQSRAAVALRPGDAGFQLNLANRLVDLEAHEEAIAAYRAALELEPGHVGALKSFMRCLRHAGENEEAAAIAVRLARAVAHQPELIAECADQCVRANRQESALELYQQAAALQPETLPWRLQIARLAIMLEKLELAIETAEAVLAEHDNDEMRSLLASIMHRIRDYDRMAALLAAIPEDSEQAANAANLTGMMLASQSDIAGAVKAMARTRELSPHSFALQATRVMYLNYDPAQSRDALRAAHLDFGRLFDDALPRLDQSGLGRLRDPERRLRIGYVSPDLRGHSVAYFALPFFDAYDQSRFEVVVYSHLPAPDQVTDHLRHRINLWRDVYELSDQQLAEQIREDGIDILVDLAGLTRNSRLLAFTARPAPIQMTYIGYPNTTGMAAIDYRITDWIADPDGTDDDHTETLIRVPGCFLCYAIPIHAPEIGPSPMAANGHVTFGSFNNFAKVTPAVVGLWADVLKAVPGSRLLLKSTSSDDPVTQKRLCAEFEKVGVAPERIAFQDYRRTQASHLTAYNDIDIALDTFPYNGTTTTCEALWMGVPVVTLAGDRHASRVSASLLTAVGFEAGIAHSPEEYVTTARLLAENPKMLTTARQTLRQTIYRSPLCDNRAHARTMTEIFRTVWRLWCEQAPD